MQSFTTIEHTCNAVQFRPTILYQSIHRPITHNHHTMTLPPNPATEIAGGYRAFTSSASSIKIPTILSYAFSNTLDVCIALSATYLLFSLLDTIIANRPAIIDLVKTTSHRFVNAYNFVTGLHVVIFSRNTNNSGGPTVKVINTPRPDTTVAVIYGLPEGVCATHLSTELEMFLSCCYFYNNNGTAINRAESTNGPSQDSESAGSSDSSIEHAGNTTDTYTIPAIEAAEKFTFTFPTAERYALDLAERLDCSAWESTQGFEIEELEVGHVDVAVTHEHTRD